MNFYHPLQQLCLSVLILSPNPVDAAAQVFGAGENLDLLAVSLALVAIIVFTILYEWATEALEHHLEETPYFKIVNQVYKELTVMGIISFSIFLMHQTSDILTGNPVAFLAFEYAHIFIFFNALMIIIVAIYLCAQNVLAREQYMKTDMQTIEEVRRTVHARVWGRPFFKRCVLNWKRGGAVTHAQHCHTPEHLQLTQLIAALGLSRGNDCFQ